MNFLKQNELTTIAKPAVQLRKLPLWGVDNGVITFEWPSEAELAKYRVKPLPVLKQMTFWFKDSNTVCLRAVQFHHMNDELVSPLFETGDHITC